MKFCASVRLPSVAEKVNIRRLQSIACGNGPNDLFVFFWF